MRRTARDVLAFVLRHFPVRGRWRLIGLVTGRVVEPTLVRARVPGVGRMELDLSSGLEREIFVTGTHGDESHVARQILRHLDSEGAVFVDVGANVGLHTLRTARRLARRGGNVIAFEPIQANADRLRANAELNALSNVRIERLGLADREGTVEVSRSSRGSGNVSLASVGDVREQVRLVRFDDWARDNDLRRVDVVKMDIEGAEVAALRGMQDTIREFRPVLVVEINPMWTLRMGTSTTELLRLLHELGYALFDCRGSILDPGRVRPVTWVDPDGDREVNVVGLPRRG